MGSGGFSARLQHALGRRWQVLICPHLPLASRLHVLLSRHAIAADAVARLVRLDGDTLSIAIDGFNFSIPLPTVPQGRQKRLEAFNQVIAETFVDPILFQGPVRPRQGDVVFDVGAHIGTTAALFSRIIGPGGKVFAFEPDVVETLRRHVAENRLENVEVVATAVGAATGTAELSSGDSGLDSSLVHALPWHGRKKTVPLVSLDEFVASRGIDRLDFIKMDIEGAEEPALEGSRQVIERFRPRWSISSYHTDASGDAQHPKLVRILERHGYSIHAINNFHIFAH